MRPSILFALAAALVCSALFAPACFGAGPYTITDLGTLGGTDSCAYGINNSGQVVGSASTAGNTATHAFLYSNGRMLDLGTLGGTDSSAYALNDSGQVVGSAHTASGDERAFLYDNGSMSDLGTLGGTDSRAYGINNSGQVVGSASTAGNTATHAFLYSNGLMIDLGGLGGTDSWAHGINASGQIAGTAQRADGDPRAFLYSNGNVIDLDSLGLSMWSRSEGINDSGEVVGEAEDGWAPKAFLYRNGSMIILGHFQVSAAFGINASGQVVGENYYGAFLYSDGRMIDLNNAVPGSGWRVLAEAYDINDAGQIVGWGRNPAGESHAFLLTPIPEPASLGLIVAAAFGLFLRRRSAPICN